MTLELVDEFVRRFGGVRINRVPQWNALDDCSVLNYVRWDIAVETGTIRVSAAERKQPVRERIESMCPCPRCLRCCCRWVPGLTPTECVNMPECCSCQRVADTFDNKFSMYFIPFKPSETCQPHTVRTYIESSVENLTNAFDHLAKSFMVMRHEN